jgi:hypothetical protein
VDLRKLVLTKIVDSDPGYRGFQLQAPVRNRNGRNFGQAEKGLAALKDYSFDTGCSRTANIGITIFMNTKWEAFSPRSDSSMARAACYPRIWRRMSRESSHRRFAGARQPAVFAAASRPAKSRPQSAMESAGDLIVLANISDLRLAWWPTWRVLPRAWAVPVSPMAPPFYRVTQAESWSFLRAGDAAQLPVLLYNFRAHRQSHRVETIAAVAERLPLRGIKQRDVCLSHPWSNWGASLPSSPVATPACEAMAGGGGYWRPHQRGA